MVPVTGQGDLRNAGAGECGAFQLGADLAVADLHHILIAGVALAHLGPDVEQLPGAGVEQLFARFDQPVELFHFSARLGEHAPAFDQLLALAGNSGLFPGGLFIAAHRLGDLRQIARALGRYDDMFAGRLAAFGDGQQISKGLQSQLAESL